MSDDKDKAERQLGVRIPRPSEGEYLSLNSQQPSGGGTFSQQPDDRSNTFVLALGKVDMNVTPPPKPASKP